MIHGERGLVQNCSNPTRELVTSVSIRHGRRDEWRRCGHRDDGADVEMTPMIALLESNLRPSFHLCHPIICAIVFQATSFLARKLREEFPPSTTDIAQPL